MPLKIAITGHRPNKLGNDYALRSPLILKIKEDIIKTIRDIQYKYNKSNQNTLLITGMALGIDTLFALIALELGIDFWAAIPFKGQELNWFEHTQKQYWQLLNKAKGTTIVSEGLYSPLKMQIRNEWMVNTCDVLISVWDGTSGGTNNCVQYAIKQRKDQIWINPKNIQLELNLNIK